MIVDELVGFGLPDLSSPNESNPAESTNNNETDDGTKEGSEEGSEEVGKSV